MEQILFAKMLADAPIPKVIKVRRYFADQKLIDPAEILAMRLKAANLPVKKGMRIAVTAGSRGISEYKTLMKTTISFLKEKGAEPFIVPSMGSHGGAVAEAQTAMLEGYGITEETMEVPILSSMDVVQIGTTSMGVPVYIDKNAYEADGIILLNRVKLHTGFRGEYESGLLKMLAIGLAKHKGAMMTHSLGFENMARNVKEVGTLALEKLPIVGGIASIENGYSELADVFVLRREEILKEEPKILKQSAAMMPIIGLDKIDALIVQNIGKEFSGAGMDTNIIGRYGADNMTGGPYVKRLGILDLAEKSHGNALGMGYADFAAKRLIQKTKIEDVYTNALTNLAPRGAMTPMVLPTDKQVIQAAIKSCGILHQDEVKLVLIRDTKHLGEIYMSEAAVKAMRPDVKWESEGDYFDLPFDNEETLCLFG